MIAYFDCYSGVAGDMILGAMLDAGLPFSHLKRELKKLHLGEYELKKRIERRGMIGGVNLMVVPACWRAGVLASRNPKTPRRQDALNANTKVSYSFIFRLISHSRLNKNIRETACAIFKTLARAEARVHRTSIDKVHFHEVGAIDSIVDIVGAAIGFDYFKFKEIYASPLPALIPPPPPLLKGGRGGFGWIKCAHGRIPIPAPATLEILKNVPLVPSPVKAEIVTPTGSAVLKTIVKNFGENPIRKIKKIGYGLGDNDYKIIPNTLRLIMGSGIL